MYRCRLVAGRRLRTLQNTVRFQSNNAAPQRPSRPKGKPRIASDWGGIRISNEPLAKQLAAHHKQTERASPNPEPQSESSTLTLPLDKPPAQPNAPILLDLPPPITLNAVGMTKPILNKSKAYQKTVANFEQFFERKEPDEAGQAARKKNKAPVQVVTTGNVGPQGYVRRSAGPQQQPTRRNAPPSVTRAAGRQGVSRAPASREPLLDMEEEFEEVEEEEEMTPEEFEACVNELVTNATEEQSIALMQDAMEALDLTNEEKQALSEDDKREVVKEWVAHNFIEDLAKKQEEIDAEEEEDGLKEIDEYEEEDEEGSDDKWLASLDEEEQELVSESLDAAATQYMRFYRREETLEPEYLEADVDFSLPPYTPPDGIQDGLHPYRPLSLGKPRPPHDFVRDNYSRSLPVRPRTLRKTVSALGPLRHAQAVVGHNASIDANKRERLAKLVAGVTSSS